MMEAWLSSSLMMASSAVSSASNRPALASKQLGYRIVSWAQQQYTTRLSVDVNLGQVRSMGRINQASLTT